MLTYEKTNILCPGCGKQVGKNVSFFKETGQVIITLKCSCGLSVSTTSERYSKNTIGDGKKMLDAARELLSKAEEMLSNEKEILEGN